MRKFKKPYNLKIISILISVIFLFTSQGYAYRDSLRVPMERYDRMEDTIEAMEEIAEAPLDGESLIRRTTLGFTCDRKAINRFIEVINNYKIALAPDFDIQVFCRNQLDGEDEEEFIEIYKVENLLKLDLKEGDNIKIKMVSHGGSLGDILEYMMENIILALQNPEFLFGLDRGAFLSSLEELDAKIQQRLKEEELVADVRERDLSLAIEQLAADATKKDISLILQHVAKVPGDGPNWRGMVDATIEKDRVHFVLPRIFRNTMPTNTKLVLTRGPDGCLILTLSHLLKEARKTAGITLVSSEVELDSSNYINMNNIDETLKIYSEIKPGTALILIGRGAYIEIWKAGNTFDSKFRFITQGLIKAVKKGPSRTVKPVPHEGTDGTVLPQFALPGSYSRSLVSGNRIKLPNGIEMNGASEPVITFGKDGSLILMPSDSLSEVRKKLGLPQIISDLYPEISEEEMDRFLGVNTYRIYLDGQGYFSLNLNANEFLREYLGVGKGNQVFFVVRGSYIELWSKDRYEKRFGSNQRKMQKILQETSIPEEFVLREEPHAFEKHWQGRYEYTVYKGNRINVLSLIPKDERLNITSLGVTIGPNGRLILVLPKDLEKAKEEIVALLKKTIPPKLNITNEEIERFVDAYSFNINLDKGGCIYLGEDYKENLRKYSGIEKGNQVFFVVRGSYIELWSKDRYEKRFGSNQRKMQKILQETSIPEGLVLGGEPHGFEGVHLRQADDKNRINVLSLIPKDERLNITSMGVTIGPNGRLILVLPKDLEKAKEEIVALLKSIIPLELGITDEEIVMFVGAYSFNINYDVEGRLCFKADQEILFKYSGIKAEEEICVVGRNNCIEIWQKDRYEEEIGSKHKEMLKLLRETSKPREDILVGGSHTFKEGVRISQVDNRSRFHILSLIPKDERLNITSLGVTIGPNGRLILVLPKDLEKAKEEIVALLKKTIPPKLNITNEEIERFVDAHSFNINLEDQDRIRFVESEGRKDKMSVRGYLGIQPEKEVILVGYRTHIEIWSEEDDVNRMIKYMEDLKELWGRYNKGVGLEGVQFAAEKIAYQHFQNSALTLIAVISGNLNMYKIFKKSGQETVLKKERVERIKDAFKTCEKIILHFENTRIERLSDDEGIRETIKYMIDNPTAGKYVIQVEDINDLGDIISEKIESTINSCVNKLTPEEARNIISRYVNDLKHTLDSLKTDFDKLTKPLSQEGVGEGLDSLKVIQRANQSTL